MRVDISSERRQPRGEPPEGVRAELRGNALVLVNDSEDVVEVAVPAPLAHLDAWSGEWSEIGLITHLSGGSSYEMGVEMTRDELTAWTAPDAPVDPVPRLAF